MTRITALRHVAALTLFIALVSCGGEGPTDLTTTIRQVVLTSPRPAFAIGKRITLVAVAYDAKGVVIATPFEWGSSNTAIVSVTPAGVVEAVGDGSAAIVAKANGVMGIVTIFTRPAGVGSTTLTGPSAPLFVGDTFQTVLSARDFDGDPIPPLPGTFVWASSDTSVLSVSGTGVMTARKAGFSVVRAEILGAPRTLSTVNVNVRPPIPASIAVSLAPGGAPLLVGDSSQAIAVVRDSSGRVIPDIVPSWTSSDPSIASVNGRGIVTAIRPGGPVAILGTISGGRLSAFATLTVNSRPVTSITLNPASATLIQDSLVALTPTLRDSRGILVTGRAITWSTSSADVATVSANNVATAVGPGVATLTASVDDARATATLTVLPRVASITVTPGTKMLGTGLSHTFVATLRDANGAVIAGRNVEWQTVGDPLAATISQDGIVSAFRPGYVSITARREGRTGSASLTSFASIVVTHTPTNQYRVGLAYKFGAALADSTGASTPIVGGLVGGLGLGSGNSLVMIPFPIDTTSMFLALAPGPVTLSFSLGQRASLFPLTVAANSRDICGRASGSILVSDEFTPVFLGNVSAPSDPLSIFNPSGVYGSPQGPLSINNPFGRYGSVTSDFSARNPYASRPPYMTKDNVVSFLVTLRSSELVGTTPQYLATCSLP